MEVLRRLRKESAVPVILVTARDRGDGKSQRLGLWAQTTILQSRFHIEELLARIRMVLRTAESSSASSPEGTLSLVTSFDRVIPSKSHAQVNH
jgi:DNA-binding response OmpR family regulator